MPRPKVANRLFLALAIVLSFAALALSILAPGFAASNTLVYGGF
jgi:hypothetical protein